MSGYHPVYRVFNDGRESLPAPEQLLWKHVLFQVVLDSVSTSKRKEDIIEKYKSINFLKSKSSSFLYLCELSGMNPDFVIEKSKIVMENPSILKRRKNKKSAS